MGYEDLKEFALKIKSKLYDEVDQFQGGVYS